MFSVTWVDLAVAVAVAVTGVDAVAEVAGEQGVAWSLMFEPYLQLWKSQMILSLNKILKMVHAKHYCLRLTSFD